MTNFGNWINLDLSKSAAFERYGEVDELMREKLSGDIQRDLRTRLDPGLDRKGATVAEAVKVKAEGNRFIIYSESQGEILNASSKMGVKRPQRRAQSVEDLFEPGSGIPEAETRPDGTTALVYRQLKLDGIFREQKKKSQEFTAKLSIENAVKNNIGKRYEEAFDEVDRRSPRE